MYVLKASYTCTLDLQALFQTVVFFPAPAHNVCLGVENKTNPISHMRDFIANVVKNICREKYSCH